MTDFYHYLINTSICSAVFYSFYHCFLRKTLLFRANRIYLLGSLLLSLFLPLVHFHIAFNSGVSNPQTIQALSLDNSILHDTIEYQLPLRRFSIITIVKYVYLIGIAIGLIRFSCNLMKIAYSILTKNNHKRGSVRLVFIEETSMIHSFFNYIFISGSKLTEAADSKIILEHEKVHIRQLHSLDLIIAELCCVFFWFNPFIFFFRGSIKTNHEYIADATVIKAGIHPVDYLTVLSKEVFNNQEIRIASNFNYSLTKKRIMMITKLNTSKKAGYWFILLIPVISIVVLAFSVSPDVKSGFLYKTMTTNASSIPSIAPLNEKNILVTSQFGWRMHPIYKTKSFHNGLDIKATEGSPVLATGDGSIEIIEEGQLSNGAFIPDGKYIVVRHSAQFATRYTHLSKIAVKQGTMIKKGEVIGYVGKTGICTGSHLHYEVIRDGKNVNPSDYILKNNL